eukprot:3464681-Alexandrium_andersonii.AAC.2
MRDPWHEDRPPPRRGVGGFLPGQVLRSDRLEAIGIGVGLCPGWLATHMHLQPYSCCPPGLCLYWRCSSPQPFKATARRCHLNSTCNQREHILWGEDVTNKGFNIATNPKLHHCMSSPGSACGQTAACRA